MARRKNNNKLLRIAPSGAFFPIGFKFVFLEHSYEVVECTGERPSIDCGMCDLKQFCSHAPVCASITRKDGKSVWFKLIK